MKKIRLGGELLHRKTPVSCIAVYLIHLVLPRCGGESWETVCEFQDANLLFPNTPASSAGDIRAKTWNKENGIRVASWMEKTNFEPNKLYGDRLMAIGENSIKIRNATRSDSGIYTLVLTSGSSQKFIEFTLHLEVLVPPTNQCIPNITQEVNALTAELPPDVCGIPVLTTKWKNVSISGLSFESGLIPGMYTACAVGKSLDCFKGDVYKLCSNYTVSASQPQNESSVPIRGIVAAIVIAVIVIVASCLVYWKLGYIRRKCFMSTEEQARSDIPMEEDALMGGETSAKELDVVGRIVPDEELQKKDTTPIIGIKDVKRRLIDHYKTMKNVALSACFGENHVDVSQVYCKLEIVSLGIETEEGIENVTSDHAIFSSIDAENVRPIPTMVIGECGTGKSTWCKNLVHQWCQYHDNKESNLDMKDFGIPDIGRFEILLYIPLKKKLEDPSFLEHVKKALFSNATDYYEYTMSYISEHRESVLLLIDGLDEVTCSLEPIVCLLKEKEIVPCSIVLTSRLNGLECLLQEKHGISLQLFQIHGMSLENSKEYASKVLDILSQSRAEKLDVNLFWKFANNIQVLSMCNIPLLCLSLIFFWIESKAISADLTDVLLTVIEYYLRRAMMREWYKVNIANLLECQHFDISIFIEKTKNKQYFREYGYMLNVISGIAKNLWCLQMDVDKEKCIEKEISRIGNGIDVKCCLETGILMKTFGNKLERTRSEIIFSHPLLFDLFVALSITMEKGEPFRRFITTKKAAVKNSCMIHMLCQLAPNIGQDMIRDISRIFDKDNDKNRNENAKVSDQRLICNIVCNSDKLKGGAPVKWLKTMMDMEELSNAKLSILTEGLKFTKELTHFVLQLSENKTELVFRLPILHGLQALKVDIENCTLLLHDEQEWNKGGCSELGKLVIKSVNIDVKTTGYIIEAVSTSKHLLTLELCPKDNLDAQILALGSKKIFYGWGRLAEGIKDMTKLSTVRLHNLQIGEHLPALLRSLCRCPAMEMLDIVNLKEIGTGDVLKTNASDQGLYGCLQDKAKQSENSQLIFKKFRKKRTRTLQLIKNTMSEMSWLTVIEQLKCFSPHILHIEQMQRSSLIVNKLFQAVGKCNYLEKLTLHKFVVPDSSWKEMPKILPSLTKLKELSLADLEGAFWSKLGDEIMTSSKLEQMDIVSCKMSKDQYELFSDKMKNSAFKVERDNVSNVEDSKMLSLDMVVTSKKRAKSKDVKPTFDMSKDEYTLSSNTEECAFKTLSEIHG